MKLEDMKNAMFNAQKNKEISNDIITIYIGKSTLETSEEDENYTRNEWRRSQLHSKRVRKMATTLETSEEDENYTRN